MPLLIQRTGLDQYGADGTAKLKALIIGGPGKGKTAWASYWPKPIYADVEGGLASVADRNVPYVTVNSSQDMLDLLQHLKMEATKPADLREYDTLVIDTLDAYQRKLKTEWMVKNRAEVFTGFEAWNYLATKCQILMTRLLNLDMNIIVNVHYKDKVLQSKDGDTTREVTQYMLQLQGETADTVFNDFDLVGWMDAEFEAVDGKRQLVHYLSFTATPEKPFLKDRLAITPPKMKVELKDGQYEKLFDRLAEKLATLSPGGQVGQIPSYVPEQQAGPAVAPAGGVGSAVLGAEAKPVNPAGDLTTFDKATLAQIARDEDVTTTADGQPIKGNTIKSELILAIRAHREARAGTTSNTAAPIAAPPAAPAPTPAPVREQAPTAQPAPVVPTPPTPAAEDVADRATGEVPEGAVGPEGSTSASGTDEQGAVKTAEQLLGAVAITDDTPPEAPAPRPAPTQPAAPTPARRGPDLSTMNCSVCEKNLADENPDFVKLSLIKYRRPMCRADYIAAKNA